MIIIYRNLMNSLLIILLISIGVLPSDIQSTDSLDEFDAIVEFKINAKLDSLFQFPDSINIGVGTSSIVNDSKKVSNDVIDLQLQCICGLKIGYYKLPVKSVTTIKTLKIRKDITELAEQCCTYSSLKKLYKTHKCKVTLNYWKDNNIWVIKK